MSFDNNDDIIDSRDVIARLEELRTAKEEFDEEQETREADAGENEDGDTDPLEDFPDQDELDILEALESEAGGYGDWQHGETLIRRSYWVDYVEELVKDIGDLPQEIPSYIEIDWEATANNLEIDYTSVDFDGVEYLMRT